MAFWIKRTAAGTYTINDLGLTLEGSGAERNIHDSYSYEALQDSSDLLAALMAGDIVRLDGPGGSTIPPADAFNDAVVSHAIDGSAHTGSLTTTVVTEGDNLYYTESRVSSNTDVAANTSHRGSTSNPHSVTKTQVGLGNVTDDAQLKRASNDFGGFGEKATPVSADWLLIEDSTAARDKKYVQVGNLPTAGGGEANTASNQGVGGIGFYDQKVGIDLQFRNLNSTDNKIGVALDAPNKEVDITLNEANVQHQNLGGAGTNTHAQIDSHLSSTSNPHSVTKTQVGLGNVTDDAQLKRAAGDFVTFANKAAPIGTDILLIEDSEAANAKKYVTVGSIANPYGTEFHYAVDDTETSTSSTTPVQKLRLTTGTLPIGTYKITWSLQQASGRASTIVHFQVQVDDTTTIVTKDHSDFTVSQFTPFSGIGFITFDSASTHTIDLDHWTDASSGAASSLKDARLEIIRVA